MKTTYEQHFANSADFVKWAKVMRNDLRFSITSGETEWRFPNAPAMRNTIGKRGGTLAANLSFMVGTVAGKMQHAGDNALGALLDQQGGTFIVTTGE